MDNDEGEMTQANRNAIAEEQAEFWPLAKAVREAHDAEGQLLAQVTAIVDAHADPVTLRLPPEQERQVLDLGLQEHELYQQHKPVRAAWRAFCAAHLGVRFYLDGPELPSNWTAS